MFRNYYSFVLINLKNLDLTINKKIFKEIKKTSCIRIKHYLSSSVETSIGINSFVNDDDFNEKI